MLLKCSGVLLWVCVVAVVSALGIVKLYIVGVHQRLKGTQQHLSMYTEVLLLLLYKLGIGIPQQQAYHVC